MPKIKEVYEYNNGSWENGTPIGADASNVDVALSDSTSTRDLQSVLGNVSVSDSSIKTQLSGKVDTDSGDIKDTVVSVLDPSSATDTSEDIDSTDVIVAAGEDQTTMWSKFNTFRKRVSNKFSNFLINSVEDVLEPSDTKTYSQAALNSYFADVIGYKTDADVADVGSVADQLSTLNNNVTTLNAWMNHFDTVNLTSQSQLYSNKGFAIFSVPGTSGGVGLYNGSTYLCGISVYSKVLFWSSGTTASNDAVVLWVTSEAYAYVAFRNQANWTKYRQLHNN